MAQPPESRKHAQRQATLRRDRATGHVRRVVATVSIASAATATALGLLVASDTVAHSSTVKAASTKATTATSTTSSSTGAASSASDPTTTTTTPTRAATTTSGQS